MTQGKQSEMIKPNKLNLGCGFKHVEGFLNVDNFPECNPDIMHDLETFPYPFDSNSVDEIILDNVLEHLGQTFDIFNGVIKELYRISKDGATINIKVPYPRHDNFLGDPTHVRAIIPNTLALYDQERNRKWIAEKSANSPLGIIYKVDFRVGKVTFNLDEKYQKLLENNEVSEDEVRGLIRTSNNVVAEVEMILTAKK